MSQLHIWTSDRGILDLGYLKYSCNWGTHIALLYDDDSDLLAFLLGMLHAGVVAKNRLCCALPPSVRSHLLDAYAEKFSDEFVYLKDSNSFQFLEEEQIPAFFSSNDFAAMSDLMDSLYYGSQIETPTGIRFVLDIQQVVKETPTPRDLAEIIFQINLIVCSKDWLQISLYDLRQIPAAYLMSALEQHRFVFRRD